MVVHTQDALAGATSKEADIYLAVDQSNLSYINSNIDQRLRLVHIAEVSYAEPSPPDTIRDRNRLQDKADGYVDNVHTLRDTFGADVVVMITETGSYCGYSFTMDPVGNAFEDHASPWWYGVAQRSSTHTVSRMNSGERYWEPDPAQAGLPMWESLHLGAKHAGYPTDPAARA
jgi:Metallo-peptidase family M12B Reprolysin-like